MALAKFCFLTIKYTSQIALRRCKWFYVLIFFWLILQNVLLAGSNVCFHRCQKRLKIEIYIKIEIRKITLNNPVFVLLLLSELARRHYHEYDVNSCYLVHNLLLCWQES